MGEGRICVVRQLGGIGDCLVMSCVYKGLREKYPNHKIQLVTGKYYLSGSLYQLAERNKYIDEILIIEPNEGTTKRTTEVHSRYFGGAETIDDNPLFTKADLMIDLNWACAAQEMAELKLHGRVITPRYKIWCDHAGVVPSSYFPVYEIRDEDKAFANQKWKQKKFDGKRVVGLNAAACDPRRGMGLGRLEALCQDLQDRGYTPVVIDPTFNFDDRFNALNGLRVSELIACVAKMDLVIATDSGVLHMAGATGVPVIGVFGPTDPEMRMKLYKGEAINSSHLMPCAPCWYGYQCLSDPNQHQHFKCMSKVEPKWIVDKAEEWLTR